VFKNWLGRKKKDEQTNGRFQHGNSHLIEVRNVVKVFQTAAGDFTALKGVSLNVDPSEFVAVIGKSGSGKSTLINMMTGIDRPTSGEVLIGDAAIHTYNEGQMAQWRGRNIGVVFQFFQLLPTLTAIENVMLPMDFCHMYTPRERHERALDILSQVEMADQAYKLPSALSGGQQQRVAIARALANDPPIIVADEPTGNLDSKTAASVFDLFEGLIKRGKTILMVTHDQDLAKRASRTITIADGEIIHEYLARALPMVNEKLLLEATKKLEHSTHLPGKVIAHQGQIGDKFFVITKGQVEIVLQQPDGHETIVDHLEEGQYFGEIAVVRGGGRTANVRAIGHIPVEVVALDREMLLHILEESKVTREEIDRVINQRASNVAAAATRKQGVSSRQ
jgi:ABC-type lipoprotein export system ATPase subunit